MSNVLLRVAAIGAVVLVAACGGGSGQTGAPAAALSQTPAAPAVEPTDGSTTGGAASAEAPPAPTDAEPPSGGGAVGDVCELVTEEELGGILGVPIKTFLLAGPPDTCDIQSTDGAPLAATVLSTIQASLTYDVMAADSASTSVSGIGEKALYNPNQAILLVLKNGALLTVAVFDDGSAGEAARLELMKQIATIAAGRM
ncbi:MAG: hypothetical protein WEE50_01195 [Chloroflexota bacterium]